MKHLFACVTLFLAALQPSLVEAQLIPGFRPEILYPRTPSLSPDGSRIAFSWQGDIWTVPVAGGEAKRITIHEAHELYPAWSPDGRWIAYSSRREGNYDVWLVPASGGSPRQLTFHSADDNVNGWSPDGSKILFSSSREITRSGALYVVDAATGASRLAAEDIVPVSHGTFSPDGNELYYTRYGSWTRMKYRGSGQGDLMARPLSGGPARFVTKSPENERWPMLTRSAGIFYYVSDLDGTPNLYRRSVKGGEALKVTKFTAGSLFFPTLSYADDRIVFERDFRLWTVDTRGGDAKVIPILAPTDQRVNPIRRETFTNDVQEARLSPDGKQIAYVVHGEVFVMSAAGGDNVRLTKTPAREQDIAWSHDGAKLAYVSDREANGEIYQFDIKTKAETRLTRTNQSEDGPVYSPDGKSIAFTRGFNGQELVVLPTAGGNEKIVARGPTIQGIAWSPDSKWLAYARSKSHSAGTLAEIFVTSADGGAETNVTRYPVVSSSPQWSPDGKHIAFASNRTTQNQVWSVPLRDERNDDPSAAVPKPESGAPIVVKIDVEEIHLRARQVTRTDNGVGSFTVTPDSRSVLYTAAESGRTDIWRASIEGGVGTRITQNGEPAVGIHFGKDPARAAYRSGGGIRLLSLGPPAPAVSTSPFSARMDVDIRTELLQMFDEAWRKMRDGFYDEKMHGCDWSGVRDRYRPVIGNLAHKEDFAALFTLALGELNASHTGITTGGGNAGGQATATLGTAFDDGYPGPGVRVRSVVARGPADRDRSRLKPGDIILKLDGEAVTSSERLFALLADRAGKSVDLTVNDRPQENGARIVKLVPITQAVHKQLEYDQWTRDREKLVEKASGGRLGYIHLEQMGPGQLERFRRAALGDLEAKDGMVLDVRFNGGGSIADEMFNLLQAKVFGYRSLRGDNSRLPAPMPAFTKPVIVLANESSFSNAEVFPWGFKALKLGKVVGTPTYGGVIGTGATDLIDGSTLRMPLVGSFTLDGANMENNGCPPDILVEPTPEDILAKRDPQLDRAIRELLSQIK